MMPGKRKPSARRTLEREFRVTTPNAPLDSSQIEDRRNTGSRHKPLNAYGPQRQIDRAMPSEEILPAAGYVMRGVTRLSTRGKPLPWGLTRPAPGGYGGTKKPRFEDVIKRRNPKR